MLLDGCLTFHRVQGPGGKTSTAETPQTIHDFGGFPPELYRLQYPAPGAPGLAAEAARLLDAAGFAVSLDRERGLDHGAWVPLLHMFGEADVPVFQVSLPMDADAAIAFRLGQALAPMRERGVLILGSGSLTHNLHEVMRSVADTGYAQAFADWVHAALKKRDVGALLGYRTQAPHAVRAHPTEEHFLPLLVALGASHSQDALAKLDGDMTYGVLSMDSFGFGLPIAA